MADDNKWDKPGYGNLFWNQNKKSDRHPDYTGTFVCERSYKAGDKIRFGMYKKQTKAGHEYFTLREDNYQRKELVTEDREVHPTYGRRNNDDDIPF